MKQYHELLNTILEKGTYKEPARAGMPGTTSLFGYQFRHNLQDGFPILTTKKIFWKGIVVELLWFLRGDTNIKYLIDNGVNIWNEDAYNYYCKVAANQDKVSFERFIELTKQGEGIFDISNYTFGDCGHQYGKVWRSWDTDKTTPTGPSTKLSRIVIDQIGAVIRSLKATPFGRRHIVTAIDPNHENDLALYWCHALFQFNCRPLTLEERNRFVFDNARKGHDACDAENIPKYYLDCQLYQRSADVFLGVPFNISSYALLIHIIAQVCNMIPGEFIHTFGDVHIYDNHKDAVYEILTRDTQKYKLPQLVFDVSMVDNKDILKDIYNVEHWKPEMFTLQNYESYPAIKAELSTGLKK